MFPDLCLLPNLAVASPGAASANPLRAEDLGSDVEKVPLKDFKIPVTCNHSLAAFQAVRQVQQRKTVRFTHLELLLQP